ncbi:MULTISPECIES: protein kinase [unclassified Pseudoalteromonas]|uniref:protein kinase domain-containing protein n=1 Tax=unclassified Pseudoalteromonas TaxID=194690 RepID=UPI0018F46BF4|nr:MULTISPECIES: protein kinase [unclassified Pseudoalteromonas]MCF2922806.1 protein kinase [Pseudoalteromonas sp. APAL1]MCP4049395.1 protein kinase family protein [bacterium]|tara:strand:+ start:10103 stop:11131 length:1029 start_codon:yes stop_codon:yes gene_type:complete
MPSKALEGLVTTSGWKIGKMINTTSGTGGNFCTRYTAISPEGKIGFLKAMDLSKVASKSLTEMNKTISEYLFEQNILDHCKDRKLTRVVTPLDSGEISSPVSFPPLNRVFYIIFELAEGDLRSQFINSDIESWKNVFKSLHHVAVGIKQLHQIGIAHQDIKPSNVLCFENEQSKISDLGRVTDAKGESPFSALSFTGDRSYAPIEVHYRIPITDFIDRRLSDVHMFGSLIYHVISKAQITPVLIEESRLLMPHIDRATYEEALPFIKSAFATIINRFREDCATLFGKEIASDLAEMVNELCYPDHLIRGNGKYAHKVMRLSMEKYISKMAGVLRKCQIKGIQ